MNIKLKCRVSLRVLIYMNVSIVVAINKSNKYSVDTTYTVMNVKSCMFRLLSTYDRAVQTKIKIVGLQLQRTVRYLTLYSDTHKSSAYEIRKS
jgi:hypothetical protein